MDDQNNNLNPQQPQQPIMPTDAATPQTFAPQTPAPASISPETQATPAAPASNPAPTQPEAPYAASSAPMQPQAQPETYAPSQPQSNYAAPTGEQPKDFLVALLLSIFVGSLGIDRFYLGYIGLGILKLVTLGGCGIWSLIDIVLIATHKLPDAKGNPLAVNH